MVSGSLVISRVSERFATYRIPGTAKLAALVRKPGVNLPRFHGVFAPNSKYRVQVTSARQGKGSKPKAPDEAQDQTPAERRAAMSFKPSVSSGRSGSRLRFASTAVGRYYRSFGKADVQMPVFTFTEGSQVLDPRHSDSIMSDNVSQFRCRLLQITRISAELFSLTKTRVSPSFLA